MAKDYGTGTVYLRGKTYWIQYYARGKVYRESARSQKKMVANKLLQQRLGDISQGKMPGVYFDRTTFDELAKSFILDYELNKRKSLERAQISTKHLEKSFRNMLVVNISTAKIKEYINSRLESGAANGTVNRELAALKRMFKIGAEETPPKVDRVPHIPMLKEAMPRKGFFEHKDYLKILKELPSEIRGVVTFGYCTGCRRGEILGLTWERVDLKERIVRFEAGDTKNSEARTIYLDDELLKLLKIQNLRREKDCDYVFHRAGKKIRDFRATWKRACKEAGVDGKLFHDLRRTGVRDMIRAGIPQVVAMRISGHLTPSVFDRYNIVNEKDLKDAATKLGAYRQEQN